MEKPEDSSRLAVATFDGVALATTGFEPGLLDVEASTFIRPEKPNDSLRLGLAICDGVVLVAVVATLATTGFVPGWLDVDVPASIRPVAGFYREIDENTG